MRDLHLHLKVGSLVINFHSIKQPFESSDFKEVVYLGKLQRWLYHQPCLTLSATFLPIRSPSIWLLRRHLSNDRSSTSLLMLFHGLKDDQKGRLKLLWLLCLKEWDSWKLGSQVRKSRQHLRQPSLQLTESWLSRVPACSLATPSLVRKITAPKICPISQIHLHKACPALS